MFFGILLVLLVNWDAAGVVTENAVEAGYSLFGKLTDTLGVMFANR